MADDETSDPRPRPEYGELAPEGWVWPPLGSPESGVDRPGSDEPGSEKSGSESRKRGARAPARLGPRRVPGWDRPVTLLLLIVGILGMFINIGVVTSAPQSMSALHASEGLGGFAMADSVPALMTAASIVQLAIFAATVAVSLVRLARRRRAFVVPLAGGILAALANFAFMTAIVATDQTLLQHYAGL